VKLEKWNLFISVLVLYLAVSAVIIFWGRGRFHRELFFFSLVVLVGIPLFGVSFIGTIAAWITGKRQIRSVFLKSIVASLVFIALSIPLYLAYYVADDDAEAAKSFCEDLVPALERIKNEEGRYPETIDALIAGKELPDYLKDTAFYSTDGASFDFMVIDQSSMMGGWTYYNTRPVWEDWD
jgi:hypothetical protein